MTHPFPTTTERHAASSIHSSVTSFDLGRNRAWAGRCCEIASMTRSSRHAVGATLMLGATLVVLSIGLASAWPALAAEYKGTGLAGAFSANQRAGKPNVVGVTRLTGILENTPDGKSVMWRNPEEGVTYEVRLFGSYLSGSRRCRRFALKEISAEKFHESYRTACRDAAGSWKLGSYPDAGGNIQSDVGTN